MLARGGWIVLLATPTARHNYVLSRSHRRSSSGDKKLKWDPYLWDTLGPGLITHLEAKHSSKQQLVRAGPQLRSGLEALLGSPEWQRALTRKAVTKRMELVKSRHPAVTAGRTTGIALFAFLVAATHTKCTVLAGC